MAPRRPTDKSTKAQILSAYDELLKEKKGLESQLAEAQRSRLAQTLQAEPSRPAHSKPDQPVNPNPAQLQPQTFDSILQGLTQLQFNFGGAVSDLSEKLTQEAVKLQEIQQTLAQEAQQLEALHDLQADEADVDTLIQQYQESAKTFEDEFNQQQDAIAQAITQARKAWFKDQEDHRRLIQERDTTAKKNRQRNGEEYTYDLNLLRQLSTEEYEQEKQRLYQDLEEMRQQQNQQWAEREKAIAEREKQFEELKTKVEAFPQDLEAAVKRAKEEGKGIAQHQTKVKADLLEKEVEGQKRTYELRIDFLEESIEDQAERIQALAKQLDAALKQVQDLAVKAIEGASDVSSFEAIREIALEQAKTQNKNK